MDPSPKWNDDQTSLNKQFNHSTLQGNAFAHSIGIDDADDHNLDAIPSSSPRHLFHGLNCRFSPCFHHHQSQAFLPIPLPRGPKIQHPIQPVDKVVRSEILVFHGRRIRWVLKTGFRRGARANHTTGTPFGLAVWQTYKNQ